MGSGTRQGSNDLSLAQKVAGLERSETYPDAPHTVHALETHFSWLFFTPRHVYKLKKPVRMPRMDFSTLAARHWNCLEELRLNRRLAPEVYLDVVPLAQREDGSLALEWRGQIVEWLVKMVRLDPALMLDARLGRADTETHALRPAFQHLARFYRDQARIRVAPNLFRRRLEAQVERNRDELLDPALEFNPAHVREITGMLLEFLGRHHELFADRAAERRLLEGHGDLRPEHVFTDSPPCVIDCLEFDRDLRICDPVEELAFLAVECRRLEARWVEELAMDIYGDICNDAPPDALWHFYIAHRAVTRAKIVAWHLRDPEYRSRKPWAAIASGYMQEASNALTRFSLTSRGGGASRRS